PTRRSSDLLQVAREIVLQVGYLGLLHMAMLAMLGPGAKKPMCSGEVAPPCLPGGASDEAVGQEVLHREARLFAGDPLGHEPRRDGRQEDAVAKVPGGDEQPLDARPWAENR